MNENIVKQLLETDSSQDKLESVARRWAYKCKTGNPQYDREGYRKLREALREEGIGIDPDFQRLDEISIFKDKYTSSEWFQPRPAGNGKKSEFMNDIEQKGLPQPSGFLLRLEDEPQNQDVITVDATTGGSPKGSIYLKDRGGNHYEVQYSSRSALGSMFLQAAEDPNTINWKASTYETAACLGLAMANARKSPDTLTGDVEQAQDVSELGGVVDYIIDVLEDGQYDWDESGKSEIVQKLKNDPIIDDVAEVISLAWGTWNYWSNELSTEIQTPYFVHGSIKNYYDAERENENIRTEGSKANTADFVIMSSSSAGSFIEKIGEKPADFEDGVAFFVDEENTRWAQVSHKKKIDPGGAQLGKIKTAFGDVFGIDDKDDFLFRSVEVATDTIDESFFGDALDKAQAAVQKTVNMISGGYEAFAQKVKSALSSTAGRVRSIANKTASYFTQNTSDVERAAEGALNQMIEMGALQEGRKIREDVLGDFRQSEISEQIAMAWNSLSPQKRSKALSRIYDPMNSWLSNVNDIVDNDPAYGSWDEPFASEFKPGLDKIDKSIVNRIFATYQGLNAFNKVIQNEGGTIRDAEDVLERFIQLQKEMYFGRTELPIWKVGQESYKLVGSGQTFREERVNFLEATGAEDMPLVLFKIKPQKKSTYGTLLMAVAEDYDEDEEEFRYTQIKFRSKGGYFDFTVEGTKSGVLLSDMK